ncbi:hypothetical protein GCM10027093_35470 [Paraburkholderia jirisanensis]
MNVPPVSAAAARIASDSDDERPAAAVDSSRTRRRSPVGLVDTFARAGAAQAAAGVSHASVRVRRGGSLGKCAEHSPFRECRGGEALQATSWSFDPFDQYSYAGERSIDRNGACEGWIREAMQRIDRHREESPLSLSAAVRALRTDATQRRSGVAGHVFGRVSTFQQNPRALGLQRYRLQAVDRFGALETADHKLDAMVTGLRDRLRHSDLAFVRLSVVAAETHEGPHGHALAVRRAAPDEYEIFDPNNGAFRYVGWQNTEAALRRYVEEAFNEPEPLLAVIPDSVQYYAMSGVPSIGLAVPAEPALPGPSVTALPRSAPALDDFYRLGAEESNDLSRGTLAAAAGATQSLPDATQGLAFYALRDIARHGAADLLGATENVRSALSDRVRRAASIDELRDLQQQNLHGLVVDLPDWTRRPGAYGIGRAVQLQEDLRRHFSTSLDGEDARMTYRNDFAEIRLRFAGRPGARGEAGRSDHTSRAGHSILVQRLGRSDNYATDGYELYDPDMGVFRYANFGELSLAVHGLFSRGYQDWGGVRSADTLYFGHHEPLPSQQRTSASTQHELPGASLLLSEIEPLSQPGAGPLVTLPLGSVPRQPDLPTQLGEPFSLTPLSAAGRQDLKRSTDAPHDPKPYALYRPSTLGPLQVFLHGGFDCARTALRNINLDLHNFDVASRPGLVDSAGYLGTFRSEHKAAERLPAGVADGYLYAVAPTPNMIDVTATLGERTREAGLGEVAAMGHIDYTQIRGWRQIKDGVAGEFVYNPDYRWDVYNQTRTAGAQLQLARLPVASPAWREEGYNAWVVMHDAGSGDTTVFRQNPNLVHAAFFDQAWENIRNLQDRQRAGLDYRGPLKVDAYGGGDISVTRLLVAAGEWPAVAAKYSRYATDPASRHEFTMGDDGRLHLANDHRKVLRIGGDGYAYVGSVPSGPSTNGVFEYDGLHLVHVEDRKFLTAGKSVYTPFVTSYDAGERSAWQLTKPDGKRAVLPPVHEYSLTGKTGGRLALYRFENDPDSALPPGAQQFVYRVPGIAYDGNFVHYASWMGPEEVQQASDWLGANNAAWLFRDGYYLVSPAPGKIEARTLDGATHWRASVTSEDRFGSFDSAADLSSNYRIGDDAWKLVQRLADRRAALTTAFAPAPRNAT